VRHPIDVMMSVWDFLHLSGNDTLLNAPEAERARLRHAFADQWIGSAGGLMPFAGSWVDNVRSWLGQRAIPVLVVRYEVLKADPVGQLERICGFLGTGVARARLEQAAERSSVGAMRSQEQHEIETRQAGAFYRPHLEKGYQQGYR